MRKAASNKASLTLSVKSSANDQALVSTLQNLPVGVIIFSTSSILFANKKALKMLKTDKGFERSIHDHSVFDLILPEYHQRIRQSNKKILAGEEQLGYELKIKNAKDEVIDVEVNCNSIVFNGKKAIQCVIAEISERVKARNSLKEAENNLKVILRGIDEVVYYLDIKHEKKLKFISDKVEDTFGVKPEAYSKDYVSGKVDILKHIHPDDVDMVLKSGEKLRKEKKPQTFIYRFKNFKTKKYQWLQERIIPQFDKERSHIGNLGITRDISVEMEREHHLKQNETIFKHLSQNASDIIYLYDFKPTGTYTYVSNSVKKILGYSPEDFYKDPLFGNKIIINDDKNIIRNSNEIIAGQGNVRKTLDKSVFRYSKKDGSIAWLETRYSHLKDKKGNIITLIGISRDVTKEKQEEQLRKQTEEKFKLIADNANDIIYSFTYHPEPKYLYISPSVKKVFGYPASQFYKNPAMAQSMALDQKGYLQFEEELARKQKNNTLSVTTSVFQYKTKSGKLIWLEDYYSPIFDEQGNIGFILGISRDITAEKNYRLELEQKWNNYENVLENSPVGIIIHDNAICLYCNRTASNILEVKDPSKLIGQELIHYFSDDAQKDLAFSRMNRAIKGEELGESSYRIRTAKNNLIDVDLKTVPFIYNGQKCVQTIISNISDVKKLEKERIRAEIAEDLNKELIKEINYRKKIQHELVTQTTKYEAIFNNTSHQIWSVDSELKITSFNRNYYNYIKKIFGSEIKVGIHSSEVKSKDGQNINLPIWEEKYKRVFEGKKDNSVEFFQIQNADNQGQIHYREIYLHPIRDARGLVNEIAVIAHDVTDRKNVEQKILDQAAKLESIFESSAHLVWTVDMDFSLTSCNNNFIETFKFNYQVEPVLHKKLHLVVGPQYRKDYENYWYPLYRKVLAGNSLKFERKQKEKHGGINYKEIYLNPIRNSHGEIIEIACLAHDITENKQFEKQIVEQSAKLKAIFESGDQLMWTIGMDKRLTSFNQNYAKAIHDLYGYYPEIGKTMRSTKSADYHEIWDERYEAAFQGRQVEFISERVNLNGVKIIRQMILYPIKDNDNKVIEISGIGFDITENKKNEERITQSLKEKEVLLKEVHHRVKNNMQVISSILNLQSSYVKDAYALNLLKECQNRIKSMAFIHESLYQTKNFESVNFSEYITTLSKNLVHTYSINSKNIKLVLTLDNLFLNLDSSIPCGLIINEIISNSLKYAFPDNRDGIIFVTLKVDKSQVRIEAGDNGVGIPQGIDIKYTETLGLQLVDTLVEQINGTLVLERHKGTKFIIEFKN
jgi:PAS domain S-box-containing protein